MCLSLEACQEGNDTETGIICKAVGGAFTVYAGGEYIRCAARGVFRNRSTCPVVGDRVEFTRADGGVITRILPRRNLLIRPHMANLDQILFVVAAADPVPNYYILDQLLVVAEYLSIRPLLAVTKTDLAAADELTAVYRTAGYPVLTVDPRDPAAVEALRPYLTGKITAFTGNTGVGKSTLLNRLDQKLELPTGDTSKKLGRGRHTTRSVELFPLEGGLAADTPGFSSVDFLSYQHIAKEELAGCFPEFAPYVDHCRFPDCSHRQEPDCTVQGAVAAGKIPASRYRSYLEMYRQAEQYKAWEDK